MDMCVWSFAPLAVALASLPPTGATPVGCTTTWTGAGGDASWSTAANWSSGHPPADNDRACIPAGKLVEVRKGAAVVGSLDARGALSIRPGVLEIGDWAGSSSIARLVLSSGVLKARGTIRITQSLNWSGGLITGDGTTVLAAGAHGRVSSGWLDRTTLRNDAVVTFDRARIFGSNGAVLDNRGEAVLIRSTLMQADGAAASVCNKGLFLGDPRGHTNSFVSFRIDNDAAVDGRSGLLYFSGGGVSGGGQRSSCTSTHAWLTGGGNVKP